MTHAVLLSSLINKVESPLSSLSFTSRFLLSLLFLLFLSLPLFPPLRLSARRTMRRSRAIMLALLLTHAQGSNPPDAMLQGEASARGGDGGQEKARVQRASTAFRCPTRRACEEQRERGGGKIGRRKGENGRERERREKRQPERVNYNEEEVRAPGGHHCTVHMQQIESVCAALHHPRDLRAVDAERGWTSFPLSASTYRTRE